LLDGVFVNSENFGHFWHCQTFHIVHIGNNNQKVKNIQEFFKNLLTK
jgi:Zn-finger protein